MPNSPDVLPAPDLLQCGSVDGGNDVPPHASDGVDAVHSATEQVQAAPVWGGDR